MLVARLPGLALFGLYLGEVEQADRFLYGPEPDGAPAAAWFWEDLD